VAGARTRTLSFIQQLVNDGDVDALNYLQESIELARSDAEVVRVARVSYPPGS
jgi:hypothetical protein